MKNPNKSNQVLRFDPFGILFHLVLWVALFSAMNMFFFQLGGQSLLAVFRGIVDQSVKPEFAGRDFVNYWMAGKLLLQGNLEQLFPQDVYQQRLEETFGFEMEIRNWSYPPHSLLLIWPLGLFTFKQGFILFHLVTFILFAVSVWHLATSEPYNIAGKHLFLIALFLLPFAIAQLSYSQNGFLYAALFNYFFYFRTRNQLVAGIMLALMTTKPQLGLLVPVLLLFERQYRLILYTMVLSAVMVGVTLIAFGLQPWLDFWEITVPYQHFVMTNWQGIFWGMMPTVFGSLRHFGLGYDMSMIIHLAMATLIFVLTIMGFWKSETREQRDHVLVSATFCILPYAFVYDMGVFMTYAAILLVQRLKEKQPVSLVQSAFYHLLFMMPLLMPFTYSETGGMLGNLRLLYFLFPALVLVYFLTVIKSVLGSASRLSTP